MPEVMRARARHLPQLKALWQTCFGDSPAYIDAYFSLYGTDHAFVLCQGSRVVSMALWFDEKVVAAGGGQHRAAYWYAVCTAPDARGLGNCRRLLVRAEQMLLCQGVQCALLVPGEAALFSLYARLGYTVWGGHEVFTVPASAADEVRLKAISPKRYMVLRRQLLQQPFVCLDETAISFQARQGALYEMAFRGEVGCCAYECDGSALKELLLPGKEKPAAAAVARALQLPQVRCAHPAGKDGGTPFVMGKWLGAVRPGFAGLYLGLAFD